jgi:hypothetical protein
MHFPSLAGDVAGDASPEMLRRRKREEGGGLPPLTLGEAGRSTAGACRSSPAPLSLSRSLSFSASKKHTHVCVQGFAQMRNKGKDLVYIPPLGSSGFYQSVYNAYTTYSSRHRAFRH